ncbi:MAG: hypothetical protein HY690_11225 [Chloroflexi bacterium]|nr:hypothetical protein [Chloroflexota bacterium]
MARIKTMQDVHTLHSVPGRAMPTDEGAVFLQLHRLANEKLRLEREVELWLRKKERIEQRMREIEQQMESLRQLAPSMTVESTVRSPKQSWRRMTLEY